MKKKKWVFFLFCFLTSVACIEFYMRSYWGFCDTILMRVDNDYEYIAQPNQDRFRFRHKIFYNEYSMRSKPLSTSDSIRILGFGDSVINGGTQTDNDSLATSLIENHLCNQLGISIRCLNISAGSWGPDNCFAYLKKHGNFGADIIFLVISSHDAYDNMDFEKIVGEHVSFPTHQYSLAIAELFDQYLIPWLKGIIKYGGGKNEDDPISKEDVFNSGIINFFDYSVEHNIPFFIYLHPEITEVRLDKYNDQGQRIISFCKEHNICLLKGLDYEINESMYRDVIHLNEKGQRFLMNQLLNKINEII